MNIDQEDFLNIGGVSVDELVDKYSTPLIVIDEKEVEKNINKYLNGFASYPGETRVIYASKAFSNRTLYRILQKEGVSLDVVSGGELYTALKAGFPSQKIYFHGNNKLPDEIELALDNNIGRFFIDNSQEAKLLDQLAEARDKKVKALIRLTPGIEAYTHEFMVTGKIDSKFGVGIENGDAMELIELIKGLENVELAGIHAHIGSQIYERQAYIKLIEIMLQFMTKIRKKTGLVLSQLDLGGGLGIPQTEDDPEIPVEGL
jgi:diaminopimelate decarboxylase